MTRQFTAHANALGLEPLGAHPSLVATFLGHLREGGASAQTLSSRAAAIRFFHRAAGLTSPTDQRVVRVLARGRPPGRRRPRPRPRAPVDTDAETLSHLARFAQIYRALAPYRKALVGQAAAVGYPVVRHLFLHFPNDSNVYNLRYQFMLGPDFLIAPVLDKGSKMIGLYLPAGNWTHLWTRRIFAEQNGQWIRLLSRS